MAINPELSVVLAVDGISPESSNRSVVLPVEGISPESSDPSVGIAVDGIPPESSDVEDPSVGIAVEGIPPESSDVEDPTLGVNDGGILGRGLPCQGGLVDVERPVIIILVDDRELVVLVVGRPGSFVGEEDNLVELKLVKSKHFNI